MAVPGVSEAALAEILSAAEKGRYKATNLQRFARAADLFGRAAACVAAAGAPPDSLALAALRLLHAAAIAQLQFRSAESSAADRPALSAKAYAITCDVRRTLLARDKAGTLRPGGLSSEELAYARALASIDEHYTNSEVVSREARKALAVADVVLLGYDAALQCAILSLSRLVHHVDGSSLFLLPPLVGAEADAAQAWVLRAIALVSEVQHPFSYSARGTEVSFLNRLLSVLWVSGAELTVDPRVNTDPWFCKALVAAVSNPRFAASLHAHGTSDVFRTGQINRQSELENARAAADVAAFGLRVCALPSCSARESTVLQFKVCGACKQAAYCCTEHHKTHWKAGHKQECSGAAKN